MNFSIFLILHSADIVSKRTHLLQVVELLDGRNALAILFVSASKVIVMISEWDARDASIIYFEPMCKLISPVGVFW